MTGDRKSLEIHVLPAVSIKNVFVSAKWEHRIKKLGYCNDNICTHTQTYRVCLIFPVVEVVAVIENVLIGGVKTGFHAVLHHLARPGGTLQLLDLNTNVTQHMVESKTSESVTGRHKHSLGRGLSHCKFNS